MGAGQAERGERSEERVHIIRSDVAPPTDQWGTRMRHTNSIVNKIRLIHSGRPAFCPTTKPITRSRSAILGFSANLFCYGALSINRRVCVTLAFNKEKNSANNVTVMRSQRKRAAQCPVKSAQCAVVVKDSILNQLHLKDNTTIILFQSIQILFRLQFCGPQHFCGPNHPGFNSRAQ